jgi:tRNA G10  N-methylase Trm11
MTTPLFDTLPMSIPPHPAKYSPALYPVFARMLKGCTRLLDPFAGVGGIFKLAPWLPGCEIQAVEIEREWATAHPQTTLGDALALPWPDGYFDAICTSPTYANRMADHHNARDGSRRHTYRHYLGRPLHPNNSGAMQWSEAYRALHVKAWAEVARVLTLGGRFVLNIKDHYRAGELKPVTAWHIETLTLLGFTLIEHVRVETPGQRHGANGDKRADHESIILFRQGGGL